MAEEKKTETEAPPAKPGRSMKTTLLIGGFMALVVGVECALAFLFLPDADDIAAQVLPKVVKQIPGQVGLMNQPDLISNVTVQAVEVELGDYSITVSQANSNLSLRVDFQLIGTVIEKDKGKLVAAMERNKHRFRDKIILKIRDSSAEDLSDPGLGLIKRRILETSNTVLGMPILQTVVFSQFSYVEQ